MARRHVADVMRHHTGQLHFFIRRQNHSGVHVKAKALIASESITLIVNGTCASELRPILAGAWSNGIIAPGTRCSVEPVYDREQLIIAVLNLAFRVPAVVISAVRDDR